MDYTGFAYTSPQALARRLRRYVKTGKGSAAAARCGLDGDWAHDEYLLRVKRSMAESDLGPGGNKSRCYLNVFMGLSAYELLREAGFSETEAFRTFDYMCQPSRWVSRTAHRIVDLLPNGFDVMRQGLLSDLTGRKRLCWSTILLKNTGDVFEYKITRCHYYEVCKAHGYPEFTRAFCNHDDFAYGPLHRHVRFRRTLCIGDGDECCLDRFERVR